MAPQDCGAFRALRGEIMRKRNCINVRLMYLRPFIPVYSITQRFDEGHLLPLARYFKREKFIDIALRHGITAYSAERIYKDALKTIKKTLEENCRFL